MKHVRSVLDANGYDNSIIRKVEKRISDNRTSNIEESAEQEAVTTICIPYISGMSNALQRIFRTHNIKCRFRSTDTLRNILSHPKDKIATNDLNNVIYQIPCGDCDSVYIGETKRTFEQRVKEHMRAVRNGDVTKNEIADHCWTNDHKFDWENRKIIDKEKGWTARKIKETIHSTQNSSSINSTSYNVPAIWFPALRKTNY